jgi:hypothetical protein
LAGSSVWRRIISSGEFGEKAAAFQLRFPHPGRTRGRPSLRALWTILRGCFFASNKESCSDRERHRGRYKSTDRALIDAVAPGNLYLEFASLKATYRFLRVPAKNPLKEPPAPRTAAADCGTRPRTAWRSTDRPRLPLAGNGRRAPVCHDDVGVQSDQLLRKRSYPIDVIVVPPNVHPHVAAIGPTKVRERLRKRREVRLQPRIVFVALQNASWGARFLIGTNRHPPITISLPRSDALPSL